ncbi:uncharacterized protein [Neodiprion pinetum]|uniref:uncharacterized protein n=1 Tax=Neodiprion pinetum TaxID=441929 RepID=UPI001EE0B592|nr:uncharacterized protein LOC124211491 [Neodiprion pinetum]
MFGDFNVDLNAASFDTVHLRDFCTANGLHIVPHGATHHTATSSTRLDLCIVNDASNVRSFGQYPVPFLSAHDLIFVVYDVIVPAREPISFTCRRLRRVNAEALLRDLSALDWEPLYQLQSVDEKVDFLNAAILGVFDIHAPKKQVYVKRRPAPWLTAELREWIRRRDRLRRAFVKTRLPHLHVRFIALRNEVKAMLRAARDSYFLDCFQAETDDAL